MTSLAVLNGGRRKVGRGLYSFPYRRSTCDAQQFRNGYANTSESKEKNSHQNPLRNEEEEEVCFSFFASAHYPMQSTLGEFCFGKWRKFVGGGSSSARRDWS